LNADNQQTEEFRVLVNETLQLFAAFFSQNSSDKADILKCQWAALKYLPTIVGDLLSVYDAGDLT